MWKDKRMYWAWEGPMPKEGLPSPPTVKRLDYVTLYEGTSIEMRLCIGVWDNDKYTPIHSQELEWHRHNERIQSNAVSKVMKCSPQSQKGIKQFLLKQLMRLLSCIRRIR